MDRNKFAILSRFSRILKRSNMVSFAVTSVLKVDLAHSGKANILFLDGSVRSFDKSGLEKLGITNYYEH